jgi:hypothetical protein
MFCVEIAAKRAREFICKYVRRIITYSQPTPRRRDRTGRPDSLEHLEDGSEGIVE